jgi:hypothetical protein
MQIGLEIGRPSALQNALPDLATIGIADSISRRPFPRIGKPTNTLPLAVL